MTSLPLPPMFAAGLALDNTFFAFLALVLFLGVVIWAGAHKKAGAALDARAAQIDKDIKDARKLREEAEALLAEYKQKKLDAEKEAAGIVAQAKADAAAYADEAKKKLAEALTRRTRQAENKIAQAEAAAVKEVRAIATDRAIAAATLLIAENSRGKGGESLITESIAAVKSRLN
jgi:F-type H+-transporting ATPase subunit b